MLLVVAAVGGLIAWEASVYACYRMSLSRLETELIRDTDKDAEKLKMPEVKNYVVGGPKVEYVTVEFGKTQGVVCTWQGLTRTWGVINCLYPQEHNSYNVISEIKTGHIEKTDSGALYINE